MEVNYDKYSVTLSFNGEAIATISYEQALELMELLRVATAKPSAKKKSVKKAEPVEYVTEYDYSMDYADFELSSKNLRKVYWNGLVTYFKLWIKSFA